MKLMKSLKKDTKNIREEREGQLLEYEGAKWKQ